MDWGGREDSGNEHEPPQWVAYCITAWMIAAAFGALHYVWILLAPTG